MNKIKCIIVDDEPASREVLENFIGKSPQLELVGICKDAIEASEVIDQHDVQLLFLDINMPKISGMDFYKTLYHPPLVIFTTAYPQFAVEGFEVDALDYLLKPFSYERFLKAINKATELVASKENDFILLKADKKMHRIAMCDIYYLQSVGDYVKVFYADKHIFVHNTMQKLLDELSSKNLFRVHKSHAIAIDKIDEIEGNIIRIKEKDIPIGKVFRDDFWERING